ncbi:MAG TPA: 3-dehydroquinate synthase [Gillisia sp.]|nr:3-dehydroquinate synthase [Gillisia sp.]
MNNEGIQAPVFYSEKAYDELNSFLKHHSPSSIFIIVDSNTRELCLPIVLPLLETSARIEVIEMDAGEEYKNIETCTGIWKVLSELDADRKSLILNLGGGVVTDLGGFVASTFKRGIAYINMPTTLLAMVDASVGGKTGVDLDNLKNQVGVITQPEMVLIDIQFLSTLPAAEMRSGLAEILKHGLIASRSYWLKASKLNDLTLDDLDDLIRESVNIKTDVVTRDPREENIRKTLNFGHTFGHAIESYFLTHPEKNKLLHGEAVAAGMIIACYLSTQILKFPQRDAEDITEILFDLFPSIDLEENDFPSILELLKYDKKNAHGIIYFVLLKNIGECEFGCKIPETLLTEGLRYYTNFKKS